jgi:hypothetical protein
VIWQDCGKGSSGKNDCDNRNVTVIAMNWVEVKMSIFSVCLKGGKNNY